MYRGRSHSRGCTLALLCLAFAFLASQVTSLELSFGGTTEPLNSTNGTSAKHKHGSHLDMPFLILLWATMVAQCIIYATLVFIPKKCYTPPFTLVMAFVGVAFGVWGIYYKNDKFWDHEWAKELLKSLQVWANVKADAILFILLPPLLFDAAFNIDFHTFTKILPSAITFALPGVLLAVTMTGCCIHLINQTPFMADKVGAAWTWETSFLTASILSATDPVAVVAILHTLGAPAKLSTLIEGEALLNDGSSMVLFLILRKMVKGGGYASVPPSEVAVQFVYLGFIGVVLGWASAILTSMFLRLISNPVIEVSMLASVVFASFFVAEHYFHASGVLCVVVFGIYMSRHKKSVLSPRGAKANKIVWSTVSFFANSCIFVLSGVIIVRMVVELLHKDDHKLAIGVPDTTTAPLMTTGMALPVTTMLNVTTEPQSKLRAFIVKYEDLIVYLMYAILVYVLLHLIRAIIVFLFWGIGLRRVGYGLTFKEAIMMTYSGIRGAVGLALAMIVETDAQNGEINKYVADVIGFQVGTIAVLTLVINGATSGTLYKCLNIYRVSEFLDVLRNHGLGQVREAAMMYGQKMRESNSFEAGADWELVWKLVPNFKLIHFRDGHLVTPHSGVTGALIRSRDNCSSCRAMCSRNRRKQRRATRTAGNAHSEEGMTEESEIEILRRNTRLNAQPGRTDSELNFSDVDDDVQTKENETRRASMRTLTKVRRPKELVRTKTPKELKAFESEQLLGKQKSKTLQASNFIKFAKVHPDGELGEEELEACAFDMQHQMYMMLLMSMKRYFERAHDEHTLNSRGLMYLNDAVDKARDELVRAADKVFEERTQHLHVTGKGLLHPSPSKRNLIRKPSSKAAAEGEAEDEEEEPERLEPLKLFWNHLCQVLKIADIDTYCGSCFYGSFANVQCALQALHSVVGTSSKLHLFLSESLIPMDTNSTETRSSLIDIQEQLQVISGEARDFLRILDEDCERNVRVAKAIMVARKILRRCSNEVQKLYSHGMFDCHLKEELDEYLLEREMTLLSYGDLFVMLQPC